MLKADLKLYQRYTVVPEVMCVVMMEDETVCSFYVKALFMIHDFTAPFKTHLLTVAHTQMTAQNKLKLVTYCYEGLTHYFPY